jgi:hypothetical protein
MAGGWKLVIMAAVTAVFLGTLALLTHCHKKSISLKGAVIKQESDPKKQLPISGVQITAAQGMSVGDCKSDSSGFFSLTLSRGVEPGQSVTLQFRHPGYEPLDSNEVVGDKLLVARLIPLHRGTDAQLNRPDVVVANVSVRYSIKATTVVNIGSAIETFQVINTANVPCRRKQPCSPDGKWKAAIGSATLDAGEGNEFRNARVSCIAGPCPFTKIESDRFSKGGRHISAAARNWSDTTTFLLEAEVYHPMVNDTVRHSYPVIFGRALNFTLPPSAEGVSIIAEVKGETIVFPLGPDLALSWAECNVRVNNGPTKVYRCELKPGYRFP